MAGGGQPTMRSRVKLAPEHFNRSHSMPSLQREQPEPTSLKRNLENEKRTLRSVQHSDKSRGPLYFNLTDYSII